jgi:hypothetical protein
MITGEVSERRFLHWASQRFLDAANRAASIEFTTPPNASWYWKGSLASRAKFGAALPGDVGEILLHSKYAAQALKEYVFDEIRAMEFSSRPSRRRCMFLFDATLDADAYAATMGLLQHHLFEVELSAGTVHRAPLSELACNLSLVPELEERARAYWRHVEAPSMDTEILFEGTCKMTWLRLGAAHG